MTGAQAALAVLKPDVLLLEEIRGWENAAKLCAVVPSLRVQVVSRFPARPQNQVVAARLPADSAWSESWQASPLTPPRGYSFAALELPGPRFLLTYALHLKSNLGDVTSDIAQREEAARQLLRHVRDMLSLYQKRGPCAVIVGGDLNTSLDDPKFARERTLRAIRAAGFHWSFDGVPFPDRVTIPAEGSFPDNCFDHLFLLGLGSPKASVKVFPGVSDHNPVVLDVSLTAADFRPQFDAEAGLKILAASSEAAREPTASPIPVTNTIEANDDQAIRAAIGQTVAVRGRVQNIGSPRSGGILFVDFRGNARGQFVGIIKQDRAEEIAAKLGGPIKPALTGHTVEIRGELILYKNIPEVIVTSPDQIMVRD